MLDGEAQMADEPCKGSYKLKCMVKQHQAYICMGCSTEAWYRLTRSGASQDHWLREGAQQASMEYGASKGRTDTGTESSRASSICEAAQLEARLFAHMYLADSALKPEGAQADSLKAWNRRSMHERQTESSRGHLSRMQPSRGAGQQNHISCELS